MYILGVFGIILDQMKAVVWNGDGYLPDWIRIQSFIKEGAMIPKYPVQQYVGETGNKGIGSWMCITKTGGNPSTFLRGRTRWYELPKRRYSLRKF